jgi:hypothetical protein
MADTYFKLGYPVAGSFFSVNRVLPSVTAFLSAIWYLNSLISLHLLGFSETTGAFVHFLLKPFMP